MENTIQHSIARLEQYFVPLSRRTPQGPCFFRVIGRDRDEAVSALLKRYEKAAEHGGVCFCDGLDNPAEPEIERFYSVIGQAAVPDIRHMTLWLGQLKPGQRETLFHATVEVLGQLSRQGANPNILKNTYIKFMCWFRSILGHVLVGIGQDPPPKILFTGDISKYEVLLLHLLHLAGCDVLYVNFCSDETYAKYDAASVYSEAVTFELRVPPNVKPATKPGRPPEKAPPAAPRPLAKPPWDGVKDEVQINSWAKGMELKDALFASCAQRQTGGTPKICSLFRICLGVDDRAAYRNRLFALRRALEGSQKKWLLLDAKVRNPDTKEAAPYRETPKGGERAAVIRTLAEKIGLCAGRVQTLLAQRAFVEAMGNSREQDPVRLFNYGVRLACWLKRYADVLFEGYRASEQPALIYYGGITDAEITLLWVLAQIGVDVLYFCPDTGVHAEFQQHFLPPVWEETVLAASLPVEPFPQREERIRASTTAYQASKELDDLLYADTGMFRDRQFARSSPVTLKTTYDEVGQLWKEEAQYRPSFRTEGGVVYVPNLFAKISGVDKGDIRLYWEKLRGMVTENTYLATSVPFLKPDGDRFTTAQALKYLHGGRLDPSALKASGSYRYGYLPDDTQDYILEKIQALIDYDLIIGGGAGLPAAMLSVLMNLDKELLRLLQNFDFTREIPKFIVVDVTETMFLQEECILLAFLNLVGFDVAVFTPTGYKNIENHLRADSFETHVTGEYCFDLTVPDLHVRKKSGSGDWFSRIFGA